MYVGGSGLKMTGLSGIDTESMIKQIMDAERAKVTKVEQAKTMKEWKKDAYAGINKEILDFYKGDLSKMRKQASFEKRTTTISDSNIANVTAAEGTVNGTFSLEVSQLAKQSFITGTGAIETEISPAAETKINVTFGSTTKEINILKADKASDVVKKINEAFATNKEVKASYDTTLKRIFLSAESNGVDNTKIELTGDDQSLTNLGFLAANRSGTESKVANVKFNGADFTFKNNDITISGLKINLKSKTTAEARINVVTDTEAIYKGIKDFVLKYNDLTMKINEKVDAKSARGYNPLTTAQKETMSDDDEKLWEDKIKKSLLRRDDMLKGVLSSMRSTITVSDGVDVTSEKYKTLTELGITTGGYLEKGLLHIDGDVDDTTTSQKTDKLKKAIEENPDAVMSLFNKIADKVYGDLSDKFKGDKLKTSFNLYNDKLMDDEISDYKDKIAELEYKMIEIEERYYKQFSALETAMQKMNSQSQWLAGQFK